ncbi:MAG: hypothetical protein LC118_08640 [Dehalococcoidia bacterium]|nr:hypothetical protein [Dehalococcoidia bacterium]
MNEQSPLAGRDAQLSLFQEEGTLPVPDWRGRTPPEMRADAPEGYRLDLSGEEPTYVIEDEATLTAKVDEELDDDIAELLDEDADVLDDDDSAGWSAPREWAPYCADTIGMTGKIRKPVHRLGALWISTGGWVGRGESRGMSVYRVVPAAEYRSPHPDLPLSYREHTALPDDHPFRYGYEGMLVTWQKKSQVLTDEHLVFGHPYVPHPQGHGYMPDPEWYPHDDDAVRSDRNPWRDDPVAWQPQRRLI